MEQDQVIAFIENEKEELRKRFQEHRSAVEELQVQVAHHERELAAIKDKLKYTDDQKARRLRELSGSMASFTTLPKLGRFSGMGLKEAIKLLFEVDPDEPLASATIADLLLREGLESKAAKLAAAVFTTCRQLEDDGYLTSVIKANVRYFSRKKKRA